jgi:Kef-type K+ transport system membrane component KefB
VGEIGLILLLLEAGVELDVAQLRETGTKAVGIGVTGTILPLVVGMGLAMASDVNIGIKSALAVGASFSPTSLGVAASALKQGKMLDTPVGQLIVSACVVDDILALILLSMFQVLVEVDPPIIAYFIPFISSIGFLFVLGGSAVTWLPKFIQNKILKKIPEQHRELTMFSIMVAMLMGYLPLLNYTKSSYLTGAFLAGATFSQIESAHHAFIKKTHQLMTWLLRVFFAASIGFQVPVKLFGDPYVIGWGFILYACVMAKFPLMCFVPQFEDVKEGASYNPFLRDRLITGLAMTCRGEFSFIIAAFALGKGLITAKIYGAIVWAVLLSCVTSPFILLSLIKYFNKQQSEYLAATNPLKQKTGSDGMISLTSISRARHPLRGDSKKSFARF